MSCAKHASVSKLIGDDEDLDLYENPFEQTQMSDSTPITFAPPRPTAYPVKTKGPGQLFLMPDDPFKSLHDLKSTLSKDDFEKSYSKEEIENRAMTSCPSATSKQELHVSRENGGESVSPIETTDDVCNGEEDNPPEKSMSKASNVDPIPIKSDSKLFLSRNTSQASSQGVALSDGGGCESSLDLQGIDRLETLPDDDEKLNTKVSIKTESGLSRRSTETQSSDLKKTKYKKKTTHELTSRGDERTLMTSEATVSSRATSMAASYVGSRPVRNPQRDVSISQDTEETEEEKGAIKPGREVAEVKSIQTKEGVTQTPLLELMSKGLGNFTEEMANLMIERMRPEYEDLARQVGTEVKEATALELQELRTKVIRAESMLVELSKERDSIQKRLEKERMKGFKEVEARDVRIRELETDLEKVKLAVKEKEKGMKRAEGKAKLEEQKRAKMEAEHEEKLKEMQKQLDHAKGDIAQQKALRRLASVQMEEKREATQARRSRLTNQNATRKKNMIF